MTKRMKFAAWLASTLAGTAAAFSFQLPPVSPGEKLLNTACISCHELRPIETSALDAEGWQKVVASMVEKGAPVKKEDEPALVKYLVANYGPLPDGPGKAIMLEVCTQCHRLDRVRLRGGTRQEWDELLSHMLNEGAPLADDDYPILLNYLAKNFR